VEGLEDVFCSVNENCLCIVLYSNNTMIAVFVTIIVTVTVSVTVTVTIALCPFLGWEEVKAEY
jgi:hypothetical protein